MNGQDSNDSLDNDDETKQKNKTLKVYDELKL